MNDQNEMDSSADVPVNFAAIAPANDLWPAIHADITRRRRYWRSGGIAASLAVAVVALTLTLPRAPELTVQQRAGQMLAEHRRKDRRRTARRDA